MNTKLLMVLRASIVVLTCCGVTTDAQADDVELVHGRQWYDAVGATPFNPGNALDIVDYCPSGSVDDDDACVRAWVDAARSQGKHLYASAGDYTLQFSIPVYDGMHLKCSSPGAVVFRKRSGGWLPQFSFAEGMVSDVSIENCGFDMRGDPSNFAFVFGVRGASRITFSGNRVFDSVTARCTGRSCQRQYVVVLEASDVLIENNHLSEGGRIKAGRPGRRIVIRNNFLEFVNDNGISVVGQTSAAWPDGTNTSEDILIDGNTIIDAISAGIFFGADGEPNGSGVSTRGVTIINNTISGDTQMCILGTLPDHASDVFIGNNRCLQSSEAKFNTGIGVKRTWNVAGDAQRVTMWRNYVKSAAPRTLDNGAYFVSATQACLIENVTKRVASPTFFQPGADVFMFGNDWGEPASTAVAASGGELRELSRCYRPSFLKLERRLR